MAVMRIKELRKQAGFTQASLAEAMASPRLSPAIGNTKSICPGHGSCLIWPGCSA